MDLLPREGLRPSRCRTRPSSATPGTATAGTVKVKATLGGCTSPALTATTTLTGSVSGTINTTGDNCGNVATPSAITGSLTAKWKTVGEKISLTSSTVNLGSATITGSFSAAAPLDPAFGAAAYGKFGLTGLGVTGAFTGGDGGATSSIVAVTWEDIGNILGHCGTIKGLKTIHLGLGVTELQ